MTKQETELPVAPVIHVAKIIRPESLSGLSILEIHYGYDAANPQNLYTRCWVNSSSGLFDRRWYAMDQIHQQLAKAGETFKAAAINPVTAGHSVNTGGFLFSGMLAEKTLSRSEKVPRSYELQDWTEWRKGIAVLAAAGTNLSVTPIVKSDGHSVSGAGAGGGEAKVKLPKKSKQAATVQVAVDA